jgi:hypothetical protein
MGYIRGIPSNGLLIPPPCFPAGDPITPSWTIASPIVFLVRLPTPLSARSGLVVAGRIDQCCSYMS